MVEFWVYVDYTKKTSRCQSSETAGRDDMKADIVVTVIHCPPTIDWNARALRDRAPTNKGGFQVLLPFGGISPKCDNRNGMAASRICMDAAEDPTRISAKSTVWTAEPPAPHLLSIPYNP